ncbi:hypothetical protein DICPUDRAFT_158736 [Dictyostelium purpureum]|uniref:Vacuolar protein sorting-associated protein 13 family protein n=1 Tax=Dictyostelium purpureum TaxID=5786 RepID=F1A2C1_DICPU|nr:uncharacterized protein DICPUDRAFT_158736 [Dictyostelium purpureum]EGC29659.1 hypothetical protein DICPUDRAFT_158736 [Dictyostelium purpureum]|eukprot:XP_003293812.1 hypothetical protein DICPUDRAFT_158736 [Dictyostelium purpureum]
MVSQIAASVLTKYLGEYIDDLNKDNIKLSFLSGDAVLQDLKIKKTILAQLFPNVIVKQAVVRKLSLHIPWNNLKGKPAIIKIEGIYVLAEPSNEFDEQYYRKKFQDEKQVKLNIQELIRANKKAQKSNNNASNSSQQQQQADESSTSFGSKLLQTVIDNLQLYIDSVHIRFEDVANKRPFSVGITLNSLIAESTDATWNPTFLKNENTIIHKIVNLDCLSIYWNSNSAKLKYTDIDDLSSKLKSMIVNKNNNDNNDSNNNNKYQQQYLLTPISAKLKVILNKSIIPSEIIPKYTLNFEFGSTEISLSDSQYTDITNLLESFTLFEKSIEFRSSRPKSSIKQSPKEWWIYSIAAIRQRVHKERYIHSWSYISEFLHDKKEYIKLFRKLKKNAIHQAEQTRLDALEWKLSFDQILLFRNLAYKFIEKEELLEKEKEREREKELEKKRLQQASSTPPMPALSSPSLSSSTTTPPASGGWFSSWWKPISNAAVTSLSTSVTGGSYSPRSNNATVADITLSRDDWGEIYDTIGYSEKESDMVKSQTDTKKDGKDFSHIVKTDITFRLIKGIVTLKRKNKALAVLSLNDILVQMKSKSTSFQFNANLKDLELIDYSTPNTQFPNLISPLLNRFDYGTTDTNKVKHPIFNLALESFSPSDNNVNYKLSIQSKPLTIVYYPKFISTINNFFFKKNEEQDEIINDVLEDLEKKAQETLESFKSQTRDKLMLAISNRTTLSIDLNLEAPVVIVPESITNANTNLLILDLGKLLINHSPKLSKLQQQNNNNNTNSKDWEEEFYDEYLFKLVNTQILLSNLKYDWKDQKQVEKFRMNIANPLNANFSLKISKLQNQFLTSLKLFISFDAVEFYLSSSQYVDLMNIIQSATSIDSQQLAPSSMEDSIMLASVYGMNESIYNPNKAPTIKSPTSSNSNTQKKKKKSYSKEFIDSYKMVEAVFSVDKFNVHLRLENGDLVHHMALLYLRGIEGIYVQKLYDTNLELTIRGMWIEDCFQKSAGNGNYLATSTNRFSPSDTIDSAQHISVIRFKFNQISKESPYYSNIEKFLDIQLPQINLILNRKTVAGLIEFLNSVSTLTKERQSINSNNNNISSPPLVYEKFSSSSSPPTSFNLKNSFSQDSLSSSVYLKNTSNRAISSSNSTLTVSTITMKATIKIDLVRILLTRENNNPLIKASFTGFHCITDSYSNKTEVNGKLESLKIHDITLEGRNYRTILTTRERKVSTNSNMSNSMNQSNDGSFDIDMENFDTLSNHSGGSFSSPSASVTSSTTSLSSSSSPSPSLVYFKFESNNDDNNQYLKVSLSSIRYIFLKRFVEELKLFLNNVNIMREYLKSSIYSAATAISNNRTNLFYEIEIQNPYIIVPLSSLSNKIFIIDLGRITIKNQFEKHEATVKTNPLEEISTEPTIPINTVLEEVLIEKISIDANNIKLLSGLNTEIRKNQKSGSNQRSYGTLVSDVNLSIKLKTPLFTDVNLNEYLKHSLKLPSWERHFTISHFEFNVSEFELKCMIDLLDGNLSEFSSEIVHDANSSQQKQKEKEIEEQKKLEEQQQQQRFDDDQDESEQVRHQNRIVQFLKDQVGYTYCKLGKFSIMYMKRDGTDLNDRLVLFYINETKMDIVNEPMETSMLVEIRGIMMKDFSKDTHPSLRNILSPLQPIGLENSVATDSLADFPPQVVIKGSIKPPPIQQSLFQISVTGVYMVFVPHSWIPVQDSIIKLTKFATDAWNRYSVKVFGEAPVSEEIIQSGLSLFALSIKDIKISLPGDTTVNGDGEKEYALFIRSSLDIQTTSRGAMGVETVTLIEAARIQVYRSQMIASDTSRANFKIISPFKIVFQNTSTLLNLESNLSVENINVNFSYLDFKLLMKIANSIMESNNLIFEQQKQSHYLKKYKEKEEGDEDDDQEENEHMGSNSSFLLSPRSENSEELIPVKVETQLQKYLFVSINNGEFILNDDHNDVSPVPLLSIRLEELKGNVFSFPQKNQMALSVEAKTKAGYFNKNIGIWEPLIENCEFSYTSNNSVEGGWMINLSTKIPIYFNITKIFIDTSISTYQIWADDYYKKTNIKKDFNSDGQSSDDINKNNEEEENQEIKRVKKYPYYIKNDSGVEIWYWINSNDIRKLAPNKEIGLDPKDASQQLDSSKEKIELERKISFQLFGNFKQLLNLPMDSVGTYTLHPLEEFKSVKLLYDISYRNGSKVLSLHSNFSINNNTDIPIVVHITAVFDKEPKSIEIQVNPHNKIPIPVEFTIGKIKYKPYNLGYEYSVEKIDCSSVIQLFKSKSTLNSGKENNNNSVSSKMICRHTTKLPFVFLSTIEKNNLENKNIIQISINPPIMVENVLACDMNIRVYHGKNKKIIGSPFLSCMIPMGKKLPLLVYDPLQDIYMDFQIYDFPWSPIFLIDSMVGLTIPEKIKIEDKRHQPLLISFDNRIQPNGSRYVSIYCEYWLINQTGLPLYFRHHIGAQTIDPAGQIPTNEIPNNIDKPSDSRSWYTKDWNHPTAPFMFSYNDSNIIGGRFSLKVFDSNWSSPFSLNSQSSANSNIQINEEKTNEEKEIKNVTKKLPPKTNYNLSVSILPSNSKFWRTKVVTFSPMYLLVNSTPFRIFYQQFDCETNTHSIIQDQSLPFQFPSSRNEKLIRIGIFDHNNNNNSNTNNIKWSGYFNPQLLGQIVLRLRNEHSDTMQVLNKDKKDSEISTKKRIQTLLLPLVQSSSLTQSQQQQLEPIFSDSQSPSIMDELRTFISVTIRVKSTKSITTTMIILNEQNPDLPPYIINNKTKFSFWIRQKKTELWDKVLPKTSTPYAWDHPILPKKLVIEFPGPITKTYRLGNLEENSIVSFKNPNNPNEKVDLEVTITANGPTRVMNIVEKQTSKPSSPYVFSPKMSSQINSNDNEEPEESNNNLALNQKYEISIDLHSIGISIINKIPTREEIVYITIDGLKLDFKQNKTDQYIQFKLDDLQIDDQRYSTNFPVFLCQSKKVNYGQSLNNNNNNNNNNTTSNNQSIVPKKSNSIPFLQLSATRCIKYQNIIFFRYFTVLIQEFDINLDESSILNALSFININLNSLNEHFTLHPTITQEEILETKNAANIQNHMIYFEMLHIQPIKVNLSFVSCKSPKETQAILGARSLAELLIGFKSNSPFLNIERAPIKFNGFIWEHPFLSTGQVIDEITLHFSYQLMSQAHKIFGSFDFIGNPIRLAESLGSGFRDFFHEPALGLVKSPQDFAMGLSKGTSSLVNNSVFGFCDSASKITGTISKGLVQLSLDDQYIKERQENNKVKPKGVKEGLEFGIRDFSEGVIKGITGIIDEPLKGATQEKSIEGFFKGVGKGMLGIAVKPTVGVFELMTRTSEGIKNSTSVAKSLLQIKRRRIPRYFPREGTLSPYNAFKAIGSFILYSKIGPPPTHDWYVFHSILNKEQLLVASNYQLLLINFTDQNNLLNGGHCEIVWKVKFNDIVQIRNSSSNTFIQLTFSNGENTQTSAVTIPTPNEDIRNGVVRKINELVLFVKKFGIMD